MTTWTLTKFFGTNDQEAEVVDDHHLGNFMRSLEWHADRLPDGSAFLIRKTDYLDIAEPDKIEFRQRGHLTLIRGGKPD